ncbi:MAG TPA: M28 family peptidase [Gemmatimonadaceae bacterium]|nr:M28 family peptidase [Gemmatimonadaceae bacterium]
MQPPLATRAASRRAVVAAALAAAVLAPAARAGAQSAVKAASRITAAEIDGDLRFLSSDLLEGRAPATRGGRLAAEYIASQLRAAGVEPGVNGSYFQPVPIDVVKADPATIKVTASGKATANLRFTDDVVVWPGSATDASSASGELVFVGYGATAPEYKWDDYKGIDVKGKVLLVLVNDPPATSAEPKLFGGNAMTYYGRWTYKYEEAERRGAAGMLIVHTTERAGYPWQVVVGSNSVEHRLLPRDPNGPAPIGVRGWIKDTVAAALLKQAGLDFDALRKQAESRDFRPVSTGITMSMSSRNSVAHMQSENVVGVVRGKGEKLKDEYVAFSAHWDHLGIGPLVNGDSIYNGASDNASGVADMLAVARAAAAAPKTRRSMLFVFVTAEESGLLGSAYFAEHPTVPASSIVANLNVDGGNLLGRTRDLDVLGENKSTLGPMLAAMVRSQGMRLSPEDHPEQGHFYRSDHFSFAKAGIPAISIGAGNDYVGRPAGWGKAQGEEYTAKHYHQPSDDYRPDFELTGAVQLSEIVLRFGTLLANSPVTPDFNADAEFKKAKKTAQTALAR